MRTKIIVDKSIETRQWSADGEFSSEVLKATLKTDLFKQSKIKLVLTIAKSELAKFEVRLLPETTLVLELNNMTADLKAYFEEEARKEKENK